MKLRFLGKDPESRVRDCPSVFETDRTDRRTLVVQGWKVTDPALAEARRRGLPDTEDLVEIPYDLLQHLPRET